jgi:hypothetical protein
MSAGCLKPLRVGDVFKLRKFDAKQRRRSQPNNVRVNGNGIAIATFALLRCKLKKDRLVSLVTMMIAAVSDEFTAAVFGRARPCCID